MPLLVLLVVVLIDPLSSLVLIFTGPVLLLLLAVIGSRTQAISDRRFAELRWLSAFFVELLRGLPTLRAFGRSREQADTLREISDRLRRLDDGRAPDRRSRPASCSTGAGPSRWRWSRCRSACA